MLCQTALFRLTEMVDEYQWTTGNEKRFSHVKRIGASAEIHEVSPENGLDVMYDSTDSL